MTLNNPSTFRLQFLGQARCGLAVAGLLLTLFLPKAQSAPQFERGILMLAGQQLTVEIANTPALRQYGLMFRTHLKQNQGMWFDFQSIGTHCMWMKNTPIDLDVAFLDENKRIVNIETMRANSLETHCANQPVRYALEVNVNWFEKHQIAPGEHPISMTLKP